MSAYADTVEAADAADTADAVRWPLAGGAQGTAALRSLTSVVLDALAEGAVRRCGPLPSGGPPRIAESVRAATGAAGAAPEVPEHGTGAREALRSLVELLAEGSADPADPLCAAHLHCPPLALASAAELAAGALNPSLDSWDQAPAASELESWTCRSLAELVYGRDRLGGRDGEPEAGEDDGGSEDGEGDGSRPDALVTTGGTEANQLAALLARERHGTGVRIVCGANAHHSVRRAAWLLGLPEPLVVPTPAGVLTPGALRESLAPLAAASGVPALVVVTAGTTDTGDIDPLPELADVARQYGAHLHVDAAYGGLLLFSERLRPRLSGLERADSVTVDLHKLGWQPVAAGLFVVPDGAALGPLDQRADYLNAGDDTEAGVPDLLGRSLRTTRRPDAFKLAVTLRALGRSGLGALVERTRDAALRLAELIAADPRFELYAPPPLTTVLFRPVGADVRAVAALRRRLLWEGSAVLGRAEPVPAGARGAGPGAGPGGDPRGDPGGGLWLKATLLNPYVQHGDLVGLLKLVRDAALAPAPPGTVAGGGCAEAVERNRRP